MAIHFRTLCLETPAGGQKEPVAKSPEAHRVRQTEASKQQQLLQGYVHCEYINHIHLHWSAHGFSKLI